MSVALAELWAREGQPLASPANGGAYFGFPSEPRFVRRDVVDVEGSWATRPRPGTRPRAILVTLANRLNMAGIRRFLHRAIDAVADGGEIIYVARDPDRHRLAFPDDPWPGEMIDGERFRPLRHELELLRLFPVRIATPGRLLGDDEGDYLVWRATKTIARNDLYEVGRDDAEKYKVGSTYRRFDRLEEPEILDDLMFAFARARASAGNRVLSLGCNDGRELEIFEQIGAHDLELWGVDRDASAIEAARARFPEHAERFLHASADDLDALDLPEFDVACALGFFQCRDVDRDRVLALMMRRLKGRCTVIVSLPNCHFGHEDILRRPWDRGDPRHDRSAMQRDQRYLARFLFRSGFDFVECFGTYDAFVVARRKGTKRH